MQLRISGPWHCLSSTGEGSLRIRISSRISPLPERFLIAYPVRDPVLECPLSSQILRIQLSTTMPADYNDGNPKLF